MTAATLTDAKPGCTPARMGVFALLLVAALWLGWKAWDVNITMSCWKDEWPNLPVCEEINGRTPQERVARLQERLAANPGDALALVVLTIVMRALGQRWYAVAFAWSAVIGCGLFLPGTQSNAIASALDGVALALPALMRAEKLSRRAASVQFDWPDWRQTLDKVREELDEVTEAAETGDAKRIEEELGDLLFAAATLSRKLGIEPEAALRNANLKFTRRFHHVESRAAADGVPLAEAGLERLDGYWNEIRAAERSQD